MQPRITAILIVRNGEPWLDRTLGALRAQTRQPDDLVLVDCASTDGSAELLTVASPNGYVRAANLPVSDAVDVALARIAVGGAAVGAAAPIPTEAAPEWIWLLTADTAPEPDALERLLAAVEVAPSVAIAGPKVVDVDDRALIRS